MSDNTAVFLCAFWHEWRVHWGVRVCDNLVKGVPACVVADFYRVYDPSVGGSVEHWFEGRRVFVEGDGVGVVVIFVGVMLVRLLLRTGVILLGERVFILMLRVLVLVLGVFVL